ncbi:ATP-binding protein [Candidatus Saccharibacteria bacterium]|nr:ATP-binding protein [Candidatus Saccharibacteria bacterium]
MIRKFAHLFAVLALTFFLSFCFTLSLSAANVQLQIRDSTPPPIDVCPNIPGIQTTVPPGMAIDADGNCYTPTIPPPEIVDLCRNIPGVQSYIPDDYFRTDEGDCFPQTSPPTDVCPNMSGIQAYVPDGYFVDPDTGDCLPIQSPEPPEIDVCRNIPGIQTTTPPGMVNNNGYCYTPPAIPDTTEPDSDSDSEPWLKNVPGFLQPVAQFFVDIVPEPVREFFRNLPEDTVNQLPVIAFVLVLVLILIPILQTIREYLYRRRLMAFYKREQAIAEEKTNFITLASHYLRTPITIMRDSITMLLGAKEIDQTAATTMSSAIQKLSDQISTGLDATNTNPALQSLAGSATPKPTPFWRSGFFWLPVILSAVLTMIANFLIGVVGEKEIGTNNLVFQLFIIAVFIVALYLVVRNYHIQKVLRQEKDILINHERSIDTARNEFLAQQTTNIAVALDALCFPSPTSPPSKFYELYNDGLIRLSNIQNKFTLLAQIKTGVARDATTFDLKTVIDRAITAANKEISERKISVQDNVKSTNVTQNEPLFYFVIASVLDNAIKFAEPGGQVTITSQPKSKTISVRVSDNGRGIDPAKLDQLFKPFSRAESGVDFSYEGLGLSLFLSRLILDYTNGNISAKPRTAGGTDVVITTPVNIENQASPPLIAQAAPQ